MACDGIWDRLTNKDCADIVKSLVHDEGETDVGLICEEVIDTALELDSRDNMTCCVVLFPSISNTLLSTSLSNAPEITSSSTSTSPKGVMKRRYDREKSWGQDSTPAKRAKHRLEERRKKHEELVAAQQQKIQSKKKIQNKNSRQEGRKSSQSSSMHHPLKKTSSGASVASRSSSSITSSASSKLMSKKHRATSLSPPRIGKSIRFTHVNHNESLSRQ